MKRVRRWCSLVFAFLLFLGACGTPENVSYSGQSNPSYPTPEESSDPEIVQLDSQIVDLESTEVLTDAAAYPTPATYEMQPTPTMQSSLPISRTGSTFKSLWSTGTVPNKVIYAVEDKTNISVATIWETSVTNPSLATRILTVTNSLLNSGSIVGAASQQGGAIAYLVGSGEANGLYVLPSGSTQPVNVAQNIVYSSSKNPSFIWSDDGSMLAYIAAWNDQVSGTFGKDFYVYTISTGISSKVLRTQSGSLIGWKDSQNIAILNWPSSENSLSIDVVNIQTQSITQIKQINGDVPTFISPNKQYVVLPSNGSSLIINLNNSQTMTFTPELDLGNTVWRPDSGALILIPKSVEYKAQIFSSNGSLLADNAYIQMDKDFGFLDVITSKSKYIAVCDAKEEYPGSTKLRTFIYNIDAENWIDFNSSDCLNIIGWK